MSDQKEEKVDRVEDGEEKKEEEKVTSEKKE